MTIHLRTKLAVVLVALAPLGAGAGPLTEVLKGRQARIDGLLSKYPEELPPAARTEVGKAIAELIYFPEMGRASLGAEWDKHSEVERKDYLVAFEELVRANILRRVDIYRTESIDYQDETVDGGKGSAKTMVKSKSATTEVVYAMHLVDGKWRIVDYSIDGVSAVRNYKSQFAKIIEKKGWAGLVDRLKKRKDEIDSGK